MKKNALLLLVASIAFPSYAIDLTPLPNILSCPELSNTHECAIHVESQLTANVPNIFSTDSGGFAIRMLDGTSQRLNDENDLMNIVDISPDKRFLVVREQFYEGNTWHIFDRQTGNLTHIGGYPLFSPNNLSFVAVEQDLDAGYSPNRMAIYRVAGGVIEEESDLLSEDDTWGPGFTSWIDNETVRFEMVSLDTSDLADGDPYRSQFCVAKRTDQGWRTTDCNHSPE
jgi:hypothetical protein